MMWGPCTVHSDDLISLVIITAQAKSSLDPLRPSVNSTHFEGCSNGGPSADSSLTEGRMLVGYQIYSSGSANAVPNIDWYLYSRP